MPKAKMSASFDGAGLSRPKFVERISEAMKDAVSSLSLEIFAEMVVMRMRLKSASMARGGIESEMRMFGWGTRSIHDWIFGESYWWNYRFDVPMCYLAMMKVPDPFDHTYKLDGDQE